MAADFAYVCACRCCEGLQPLRPPGLQAHAKPDELAEDICSMVDAMAADTKQKLGHALCFAVPCLLRRPKEDACAAVRQREY